MGKDPAVLFYSGDFLNGCSDLTMEERGQYITLLCIQHQKGRLSEKNILLSVGKVSDDVMAKFKKDEKGLFYNERMENEAEKRSKYCESRRKNKDKKTYDKHMTNICETYDEHMLLHMENENRNRDINDNVNSKKAKIENFDFAPILWHPILIEWIEYRKSIKKKLPDIKKTFEQIVKLSGNNIEVAQKIIDQSIANGWQGLFELKTTPKNYEPKLTAAERGRQQREQVARNLATPIIIDPNTDFFKLPPPRKNQG